MVARKKTKSPVKKGDPSLALSLFSSPQVLFVIYVLFLLLGYFLLSERKVILGFAGLFLSVLAAWRVQSLKKPFLPGLLAFGWVAGILFVLYGFLAIPAMRIYLPWAPTHLVPTLPMASMGFVLLIGGFAWLRADEKDPGPGSWVSRFWLAVILGVAAWMRLKDFHNPVPQYWFDTCLANIQARNTADFPDERFLIFPYSAQPPFYEYVITLGYWIFPGISSIVLQKFVWALFDLVSIWIHYLLGKEAGGRRTGLILAAAMAFSKPMLTLCVSGMNPVTVSLTLGVMMLFTLRYFNRPDLKHSLQWGAAVGFGAYTIAYVRPFLWWLPVAVLAATLWRHRKTRQRLFWGLGAGVLALWTYLYFQVNDFLPAFLAKNALISNRWTLLAVAVGFALLYRKEKQAAVKSPEARSLVTTLAGLVCAAFLIYPMASNTLFSGWAMSNSVFNIHHPNYNPGGVNFLYMLKQFWGVFEAMFIYLNERQDMSLQNEAFFSLSCVPLAFVAAAWFLVKRRWKETFILLSVGIGMIPHTFSLLSHSGRMMSLVTPLFLLGAMGLDGFIRGLRGLKGGKVLAFLAVLGLLGYAVWNVHAMTYRFDKILPKHPSNEYVIFQEIRKDFPRYRIYLWENGGWCNTYPMSALVDEGEEVFNFNPDKGNEVPVLPGKAPPDVAIYFQGNDEKILAGLHKAFPRARFEETFAPNQSTSWKHGLLGRVYIEGKDLEKGRPFGKPFLTPKPVPEGAWRYLSYLYKNGLGYGIIRREDWVSGALGTLPLSLPLESVVVEGNLHIPMDGKYQFSVKGANFAVLDLNGKRVLDFRPSQEKPENFSKKVSLKAGDYRVHLRTFLQMGLNMPPITVQFPGEIQERPLGSF